MISEGGHSPITRLVERDTERSNSKGKERAAMISRDGQLFTGTIYRNILALRSRGQIDRRQYCGSGMTMPEARITH